MHHGHTISKQSLTNSAQGLDIPQIWNRVKLFTLVTMINSIVNMLSTFGLFIILLVILVKKMQLQVRM